MQCKCAKTGSAGIETRVSVFSQLTLSVQRVSNKKRLPRVAMIILTRTRVWDSGYGSVGTGRLFSKLLWHEVLGRGGGGQRQFK